MLVEKYGGVAKLQGIWGSKQLYIADPTALHHMFVKDQYSYELANWLVEDNKIVFGEGLFSTTGEHHRKQKKMFNPAFSSACLRDMVPTFYEVAYKLRDAIASKVEDSSQEVDIFHWTSRSALEIIGRAGLGHSFDKFDDGPPDEYSVATKNLVSVVFKLSLVRRFLPFITTFGSPGFRRFLLERLPSKNIQKAREIVDIMHRTSVNIFHAKKAALQQGDEAVLQQVGQGKDIMSILLKANMEAADEDRLPDSELISQITCMIFGAVDTTSRAMARIIHVLAQNPDAQERVRNEIMEAQQANGDIDFDTLMDLPYLDAIMRETLRLHPTNPFIPRTALDDIILPFSKPIIGEDGMQMREIFVPKGTNITVSILGVNRYSELWGEDAYEWKPERWLSSLPDSVTQARIPGIFSHIMTFTGGTRACIGFQFAQMEIKIVLSLLLKSFRFSLTEQEIYWNLGGLVSPTVKGGPAGKVHLPLMVTLIKEMQ